MSRHKPKIIAETISDFQEIESALAKLPDSVIENIESAHKGFNIECKIKFHYNNNEDRLTLPNFTTQIQHFGDYIGIYCGQYFFRIEEEMLKKNISYLFIEIEKK